MKIEHVMENGRCIHCKVTDAETPTCLVGGKVVQIGEKKEREPFRSFDADLDSIRARRAELFPPPKPADA